MRAQHTVATLVYQGPSFYLNFKLKKGQNSKIIAFGERPLVLLLHLVMMSKYSKFGDDIYNIFRVMDYI